MKLKSPNQRDNWKRLVNRESNNNQLWEPSKDSCVCSFHFVDGESTTHNPNPTIKLGYNSIKRSLMFSPPVAKRKRTTGSSPYYSSTTVNKTSMIAENKEEDQILYSAYWLASKRILISKWMNVLTLIQ